MDRKRFQRLKSSWRKAITLSYKCTIQEPGMKIILQIPARIVAHFVGNFTTLSILKMPVMGITYTSRLIWTDPYA